MIIGVVGIAVPIYADMMGASLFIVGLIGSAGGLIYSFMPFISGVLCERIGRKRFISASLFSYGSSCLLYSLVNKPLMLIPIKFLEWISVAAFWPSIESIIADSAPGRLEDALKKFNMSWGLAMIIGPLLGGALISKFSIISPFILSMFIAFSFGSLSILMIKEPDGKLDVNEPSYESLENGGDERLIATALASIFLFSSTTGILVSLFPSYATNLGISAFEIGVVSFAFGAMRAAAFYQANRIERYVRKAGMFLLGSLTIGVASLATFYSHNTSSFLMCFLIFGFGAGISYAASIASLLRWHRLSRGHAAGVFESFIGAGYFLGPLIGGFLSNFAANAPYIYISLLSFTVLLVQLTLKRKFSHG